MKWRLRFGDGAGLLVWALMALGVVWWNWPRQDWLLLRNRLINSQAVERLGYGGYLAFDVVDSALRIWRHSQLSDIDAAPYRAYLAKKAAQRPAPVAGRPHKHVIYLQLESMEGVLIGGRKDGKPVMPFLESLARKNVYFANAVDNTASGRTTDAEFMVLTSLVPVPRPPVYVSQHLDKVPSLPRVLDMAGYHTISLHGFNRAFWHRGAAHVALGFQETRFEDDMNLGDRLGWGWSDKAVLAEAARLIVTAKQPTFLHVITLSSHYPYHYVPVAQGLHPGRIEADYLRSARYVDEALREFFAKLKAAGVLDNCLIAIYGDHDSAITPELETYLDSFEPRALPDTIPLVMVGFHRRAKRVVGMAGLQDVPVMMLEQLGLPVPFTFTGNGWGHWGRTVGATHGAVENAPGGTWRSWEPAVDQEILTRLAINHPQLLQKP